MELDGAAGLLDARPPTLENAGLEDCALPAHAIQEAFLRAADALQNAQQRVQSTATGIFGSAGNGEGFAKNPGPSNGFWEDSSVDFKGSAVLGEGQSCVGTKAGGLLEEGHDVVVGQGVGQGVLGKDGVPKLGDEGCVGGLAGGGPKLGDDGCVEGLAGDKGEPEDTTGGTEDGPILVLA